MLTPSISVIWYMSKIWIKSFITELISARHKPVLLPSHQYISAAAGGLSHFVTLHVPVPSGLHEATVDYCYCYFYYYYHYHYHHQIIIIIIIIIVNLINLTIIIVIINITNIIFIIFEYWNNFLFLVCEWLYNPVPVFCCGPALYLLYHQYLWTSSLHHYHDSTPGFSCTALLHCLPTRDNSCVHERGCDCLRSTFP